MLNELLKWFNKRLNPAAMTDAALHTLFPYLRERTYLDTAAAGLSWAGHGSAVARFYDELKNRGYDARPEWFATTQRVRARLANWLGVTPRDLTLVSNTTEGLNLAAHSLRYAPGDRIVFAADEFPSLARIWAPAQAAGATLVPVAIGDEASRQAALLAALDDRTRLLAVSQTHWSTGTTLDLGALVQACRRQGTLLMVDGIQALGAVPVRLDGVDIYAASFFKWMVSGFGIGLLVTSERARVAMQPAYQGYANMDDAAQLQYAHVNIPAVYGLDATLDVLESIGWPVIFERVRALGDRLVDALDRCGLELVTARAQRAGIVVVRVNDGAACAAKLSERGISVSPHFYNTPEDVERCVAALAEVVAGA
jgi:cysteine desulfurase/selenocysteine lyase